MKRSVAVIMAGGKSSRMQEDKALLPFGGFNSLCEFQYRKLERLFSKVYVSSKSDKFDFEVEIIEDIEEESSPLVALVSIFETLAIEECFVLSVDAPFVDEKIIDELYRNLQGEGVTVATSSRGIEPLCAIYKRGFLKEAKCALSEGEHRLQTLFERLEVNQVWFKDEGAFENLNYSEEYLKAVALQQKSF